MAMQDQEKRTSLFTPEKIIAFSAILVSLCSFVVSVYEANIFRNQQKASVWPFLEFGIINLMDLAISFKTRVLARPL